MICTVDTDVLLLAKTAVQLLNITELEKASDISQPMRWQVLLGLKIAKPCHSYMHSVGVTQYPPLPAGVRVLCVKYGSHLMRLYQHYVLWQPLPVLVMITWGVLEHFIVLHYDHASSEVRVNEAQKQLNCQKGSFLTMDGLPPIQAALLEHTKRAAYQAGHI